MTELATCKEPGCDRKVDHNAAKIMRQLRESPQVSSAIIKRVDGDCDRCIPRVINDIAARARIARQGAAQLEAHDDQQQMRARDAWKMQESEVSASKIAGVMTEDRARVLSYLVELNLVESRITGFDGRYVFVDRDSFLDFLEKFENEDPEVMSALPDFIITRWQKNLPTIKANIASGALKR